MKKKYRTRAIILAVSCTTLVVLLVIARFTGMLQSYTIPTISMNPTLKTGQWTFSTNLIKPERFNLITFEYLDTSRFGNGKKEIWVFRIAGMPGDIIEMRNGNLYVNSKPADIELNVKNEYDVSTITTQRIADITKIDFEATAGTATPDLINMGDSCRIYLTNEQIEMLKKEKIGFTRFLNSSPDEAIKAVYQKDWNADQFGPYAVPADHYFLMGDNRHLAMDSRYIGPVPASSYNGTVLNH